jgi:hypothetical protein
VVSPARPAAFEGRSSWLAIAALVAVILGFEAWLAWGGTSPGKVPGSLSTSAFLNLVSGQTSTFRPGRVDEGSVISCTSNGLRVAAAVPARGRFVSRHLHPAYGSIGADLGIVHRSNNSVTARCKGD